MNLFEKKSWTMHNGGIADYKIQCDALTDEDIETIAWIISTKGPIKNVYGVPHGGVRLAGALQKYVTPLRGVHLIVDDVLTTGQSMENARLAKAWPDAVGVVMFARNQCPTWIRPLFEMRIFGAQDTFGEQ